MYIPLKRPEKKAVFPGMGSVFFFARVSGLFGLFFILFFSCGAMSAANVLVPENVRERRLLHDTFFWLLDEEGGKGINDVASVAGDAFAPLSQGLPITGGGPFWMRMVMPASPEADGGKGKTGDGNRLVLRLGDLPPGQTKIFFSDYPGPVSSQGVWHSEYVVSGEDVLLPRPDKTPVSVFVRTEEAPGLWFAPSVRPRGEPLPAVFSLELLLPAIFMAMGMFCLLRSVVNRTAWAFWAAFFLACLLLQILLPLPGVSRPFALKDLPALLAPGLGLMVLPHIARSIFARRSLSRTEDKRLWYCTVAGAALALLPLVPGLDWITRLFPLWPLLSLIILPLFPRFCRDRYPGALSFCLMAVTGFLGACAAFYGIFDPGLHPLVSKAGLWGYAVGSFALIFTSMRQTQAGRATELDISGESPNLATAAAGLAADGVLLDRPDEGGLLFGQDYSFREIVFLREDWTVPGEPELSDSEEEAATEGVDPQDSRESALMEEPLAGAESDWPEQPVWPDPSVWSDLPVLPEQGGSAHAAPSLPETAESGAEVGAALEAEAAAATEAVEEVEAGTAASSESETESVSSALLFEQDSQDSIAAPDVFAQSSQYYEGDAPSEAEKAFYTEAGDPTPGPVSESLPEGFYGEGENYAAWTGSNAGVEAVQYDPTEPSAQEDVLWRTEPEAALAAIEPQPVWTSPEEALREDAAFGQPQSWVETPTVYADAVPAPNMDDAWSSFDGPPIPEVSPAAIVWEADPFVRTEEQGDRLPTQVFEEERASVAEPLPPAEQPLQPAEPLPPAEQPLQPAEPKKRAEQGAAKKRPIIVMAKPVFSRAKLQAAPKKKEEGDKTEKAASPLEAAAHLQPQVSGTPETGIFPESLHTGDDFLGPETPMPVSETFVPVSEDSAADVVLPEPAQAGEPAFGVQDAIAPLAGVEADPVMPELAAEPLAPVQESVHIDADTAPMPEEALAPLVPTAETETAIPSPGEPSVLAEEICFATPAESAPEAGEPELSEAGPGETEAGETGAEAPESSAPVLESASDAGEVIGEEVAILPLLEPAGEAATEEVSPEAGKDDALLPAEEERGEGEPLQDEPRPEGLESEASGSEELGQEDPGPEELEQGESKAEDVSVSESGEGTVALEDTGDLSASAPLPEADSPLFEEEADAVAGAIEEHILGVEEKANVRNEAGPSLTNKGVAGLRAVSSRVASVLSGLFSGSVKALKRAKTEKNAEEDDSFPSFLEEKIVVPPDALGAESNDSDPAQPPFLANVEPASYDEHLPPLLSLEGDEKALELGSPVPGDARTEADKGNGRSPREYGEYTFAPPPPPPAKRRAASPAPPSFGIETAPPPPPSFGLGTAPSERYSRNMPTPVEEYLHKAPLSASPPPPPPPPLPAPEPESYIAPRRESVRPEPSPVPRVLIGEAVTATVQRMVMHYLVGLAHESTVAQSNGEVLQFFEKKDVSLIILDMDTAPREIKLIIKAVREMEAEQDREPTGILCLVGASGQGERIVASGASAFLIKPFAIQNFLTTVGEIAPRLISPTSPAFGGGGRKNGGEAFQSAISQQESSAFSRQEEKGGGHFYAEGPQQGSRESQFGREPVTGMGPFPQINSRNGAPSPLLSPSPMRTGGFAKLEFKDAASPSFPGQRMPAMQPAQGGRRRLRMSAREVVLAQSSGTPAAVRAPYASMVTPASQNFSLPGMDESLDMAMMPLLPGLLHFLENTYRDCLRGREAGSYHQVWEAVNRLAGRAETFGLDRMGKLARCVEQAAKAADKDALVALLEDLDTVMHAYTRSLKQAYDDFLITRR